MANQLQLRVSLPDRPGSLGRVAAELGAIGADILSVQVLGREHGVATDDFVVAWPTGRSPGQLRERLESVRGVRVLGIGDAVDLPGCDPHLDLLTHVLTAPSRALTTLVDMALVTFAADWAVVMDRELAPERWLAASWTTPTGWRPPPVGVVRPTARTDADGRHLAVVPLPAPGVALVLVRNGAAPPFHPVELRRIARVVELVGVLLHPLAETGEGRPAVPAMT